MKDLKRFTFNQLRKRKRPNKKTLSHLIWHKKYNFKALMWRTLFFGKKNFLESGSFPDEQFCKFLKLFLGTLYIFKYMPFIKPIQKVYTHLNLEKVYTHQAQSNDENKRWSNNIRYYKVKVTNKWFLDLNSKYQRPQQPWN